MDNNILGTYVNGNTIVAIYKDGTKERYIKSGEIPAPEFPESIDLKITNRCTMGCHFCAESSTPDGVHANLYSPLLDSIHPYTELAIGGGNPLDHPELVGFLYKLKRKHVICNMTVNSEHFMKNLRFIRHLQDLNLIHGLGVSVPAMVHYRFIETLKGFRNTVVHTIAGYTPSQTYDILADHGLNLLILGYKVKGRGADYCAEYNDEISRRIRTLSEQIVDMREYFSAIAFDNLAVRQLKLSERFNPEEMSRLYMGDDGEFTMYIDLVRNQFAKSSSHPMKCINSDSVKDLFGQVHEKENYLWQ